MPAERSTLSAQQLKKRYKSRTVVHDVSFEVASGEVVGLLGPNGAGKTTCFYMVVGLIAADGGEVRLDQHSLTHLPIHRRARLGLSYLPQEASVFRGMTVADNIRAILEISIADRAPSLSEDLSMGSLPGGLGGATADAWDSPSRLDQ